MAQVLVSQKQGASLLMTKPSFFFIGLHNLVSDGKEWFHLLFYDIDFDYDSGHFHSDSGIISRNPDLIPDILILIAGVAL